VNQKPKPKDYLTLPPIMQPDTPDEGFIVYCDVDDGNLKALDEYGETTVLAIPQYPPGSPDYVFVDDDFDSFTSGWGYDHFNKIQDGINAVNEGGTVYVYDGTYNENVEINKPIDIMGESENVIVNPSSGSSTINILSNNVNISYINATGITVKGFRITDINNIYIDNCSVSNSDSGFAIYDCNNVILKNSIAKDTLWGVHIFGFLYGNDEITGCDVYSNTNIGIYVGQSPDNVLIHHNNIFSNGVNAFDEGDSLSHWDYNYYDDYTGLDGDGYGIGDTPYDIGGSAGEQDIHPLMNPLGEYIIFVDDDGTVDFTSIQEAIDNAQDGDIVYVFSGYYDEHVVINKSIDLIGEDTETTYVGRIHVGELYPEDAGRWINVSGFHLGSYYVSHNYIYVRANDISVTDCIIEEIDTSCPESHGIGLHGDNLIIANNTIINIQYKGIFGNPKNSDINNNSIYNIGANGIHFEGSCFNNILQYNIFNSCGMYCIRLRNSEVHDNEICFNDFNGLPYQDLGINNYWHDNS
jgi:parallel beta-helix repeat protein